MRAMLMSLPDQCFFFKETSLFIKADVRLHETARYANTTVSAFSTHSRPKDTSESLSSFAPPSPISLDTVPAASRRAICRRRRALATLPCSPVSARSAKAALPVADKESRCGRSPQNIPLKSGPWTNMAVVSSSDKTVDNIRVGPTSQLRIFPVTIPLTAIAGLGAPITTFAFGAKFTLSIFTSVSNGRPFTYKVIADFLPIIVLFEGL
mmetsp:Transcript_31498/g.76021  ORF Transcript_31498/g.76021 Transcript_31498/m.76021 type:complete len:209 (-) Transcript_31498:4001-4627(-)